jgi:2-iminobutanoate/2-iminopropanoate deaminase
MKYPMADGQTEHRPPLSMYRRSGNFVFVAGHGAVNNKGEFIGDDFETQFRETIRLLKITFDEAKIDFSNIISVRSYVQNPQDLPLYNQLYREYFVEPYPTRTTITSCLPPGLLYEIECVVEVDA